MLIESEVFGMAKYVMALDAGTTSNNMLMDGQKKSYLTNKKVNDKLVKSICKRI